MYKRIEQFSRSLAVASARLLLAYIFIIFFGAAAYAGSVNLAWDANTEANLAGYNVYRSTQSGVVGAVVNGALITGTTFIDSVAPGAYYYVVRAVLVGGAESGASNELPVVVPDTTTPTLVAPANLLSQCSTAGDSFTVSWTPVTGAAFYYLRVDNTSNNVGGSWYITDGVDFNLDAYANTTFAGAAIAGQAYNWWVHAGTAAGVIGPPASGGFTCTASTPNTAPVVNAGADRTITLPSITTLTGTATDDGKPNGALTYRWTLISGSGATLSNAASLSTDVSFSAAGSYTFRLTVSDGSLPTSDDVVVTVNPAPTTLAAPTGLVSQCSADGKSFTVRWNSVSGAASYAVRVDYVANNVNSTWYVDSKDYSVDRYTNTSFTGSDYPAQQYKWWVHSATAAGDLSAMASSSFTCSDTSLDTTAPTVSMTAPATGASITGSLTVAANASDNTGVAGVQFRVNGVNLGAENTTAPYGLTVNVKKWTAGAYVLDAVARDAAGNRTTSAPVSVSIGGSRRNNNMTLGTAAVAGTTVQPASDALTIRYSEMMAGSTTDSIALISLQSGGDVVSETAVQASAPVRQGRVYVRVKDQTNTGLAVANNETETAVISFYFTDNAGNDFGHGVFTVEGKQNIAAFVDESPFDLTTATEGTLTLESSRPVAITALQSVRNNRGEFLMTTLPIGAVGTASNGGSIVVPQFADGAGWASQVVLTNPTDVTLTGSVEFFSAASAKASALPATVTVDGVTGSTFHYVITPRGSIRLQTSNSSADVRTGYAIATSSIGPVPQGLAMFSFGEGATTLSQAGVQAQAAGTAFHTIVELNGSVRSGLAIANVSGTAAKVTLTLQASDSTTATASFEIPAGGHVPRFVDELFGKTSTFQGVLRVTSTVPVAVTGLRMRTNNHGRMIVTGIPVVNESSAATNNSGRMFPIVVNGGGYTTTFIGLPGGQQQ